MKFAVKYKQEDKNKVINLLKSGKLAKEIAWELGIGIRAVNYIVNCLKREYDVVTIHELTYKIGLADGKHNNDI